MGEGLKAPEAAAPTPAAAPEAKPEPEATEASSSSVFAEKEDAWGDDDEEEDEAATAGGEEAAASAVAEPEPEPEPAAAAPVEKQRRKLGPRYGGDEMTGMRGGAGELADEPRRKLGTFGGSKYERPAAESSESTSGGGGGYERRDFGGGQRSSRGFPQRGGGGSSGSLQGLEGGRRSPPPSHGGGRNGGDGHESRRATKERSPPPAKKAPPKEYSKPAWAKVGDESSDTKTLKQATSILNKLTLEKFDRLSTDFCALPFDSVDLVTGVIDLVVDKAQHETHFVGIYAELCVKLSQTPMTGIGEVDKGKKFRRLLLERCQAEFERDHESVIKELEAMDEADRARELAKIRKRYIGHMYFIGALYKHEMLKESIMHHCVQELFGDPDEPDGEKIECLAKLMSTIGKQLDAAALEKKESMKFMKAYFKQLKKLTVHPKLEARIRFMIRDLCELRDDLWKPRREVETAKTIAEIHDDIQREADIKAGIKPRSKATRDKADKAEKTDDGWETVPTTGGGSRRPPPVVEKKSKSPKEATMTRSAGSMGSFGGFASLTSEKKKKKKDKDGKDKDKDKDEKKKKKKKSADNLKDLADAEEQAANANAAKDDEPPFDESAYKAKCKAAIAEYMSIEDLGEVAACADDELDKLGPRGKRSLLVLAALDVCLDGKAKDRDRVAPLLVGLAEKKVLEPAHVADAFADLLEFLPDIAIDTPKAAEWLGDVLKALKAGGHADLAFLDSPPPAVADAGDDAVKTWDAFKAYVHS